MGTIFEIQSPNGYVIPEDVPSSIVDESDFQEQYVYPSLSNAIPVPQVTPYSAWALGALTEIITAAPFDMQILGMQTTENTVADEEFRFYAEDANGVVRHVGSLINVNFSRGIKYTQSSIIKEGERVLIRKANSEENPPANEASVKIIVRKVVLDQLAREGTKYNAALVYPELANPIPYTYEEGVAPWTPGAIVEVVPKNTIDFAIRILGVEICDYADSVSDLVARLFIGDSGEEVLVASIPWEKFKKGLSLMQSIEIPRGERISIQFANSVGGGGTDEYPVKLLYCKSF